MADKQKLSVEEGKDLYGGFYRRNRPDLPRTCPTCGGELIHKDRIRLFVYGFVVVAMGVGIFITHPIFILIAIFMVLIGIYLIHWADRGKGLWCRKCKGYPR